MWRRFQDFYIAYLIKKGDRELSRSQSRKFHLRALKFAKKYKREDNYASIYLSIGVSCHINEEYSRAFQALNLAQRYPVDDLSYDLIVPLKLDILFFNEKYEEARRLGICSIRQSSEKIYETYLALSEIYLAMNIYHKAIIYGKESLLLSTSTGYDEGIEQAINNLMDIYRITGDYETALAYFDKIEVFGISQNSAFVLEAKYNILVKQKKYNQAKELIPTIEEGLKEEHNAFLLHTFYGLTLECFKESRDKEGFDLYFNKFITTNQVKDNYLEKWLVYSQAGDFYRELQLNQEAIAFYKKMAYFLEQLRLSTLNRETLDRVDFFRDKYYYLLGASLFMYEQQEYNLAFYFLESSKSATLRDIDPYKSLAIKSAVEVKGYF